MGTPTVELLLKGEILQRVAFPGDRLRIGRMKENDLVIDNLSVSRFHAVVQREGERLLLEDVGSENGCWLRGRRVEGRVELPWGEPVRIGKHVLVVKPASDGEVSSEPAPAARRSDPWDAAATYFAGPETQARLRGDGEEPDTAVESDPAAEDGLPEAVPEIAVGPEADAPAADGHGAPGGRRGAPAWEDDLGEGDLFGAEAEGAGGDAPSRPAAPGDAGASGGGEALFDFGAGNELAVAAEDFDVAAEDVDGGDVGARAADVGGPDLTDPFPQRHPASAAEIRLASEAGEIELDALVDEVPPGRLSSPPPHDAALHAGLILQHAGRLEGVWSWDRERLCVGRSPDCEIPLDAAGVSRRHALFVREGDAFEVRDLGSVNGTRLNGAAVQRQILATGDVVEIEDFAFTFVLDRSPISSEIVAEAPGARAARADGRFDLTLLGDALTSPGLHALAAPPDATAPPRPTAPAAEATDAVGDPAADAPDLGDELDLADEGPHDLGPGADEAGDAAFQAAADPEPALDADFPDDPGEGIDDAGLLAALAEEDAPEDEAKPLTEVEVEDEASGSVVGASTADPARSETFALALHVAAGALPEPLRRALAGLDRELRIPVELVVTPARPARGGDD